MWWGINWFALELRKAQAAEGEAARIRKARAEEKAGKREGAAGAETSGGEGGSEGEETETDTAAVDSSPKSGGKQMPTMAQVHIRGGPQKAMAVMESARLAREGSGTGTGLEPPPSTEQTGLLKRKSDGEGSSADLSSVGTDSEWEKVSEGGQ